MCWSYLTMRRDPHDDQLFTCTIAPTILRVSWKMRSFDQTLFMFCIRAAMLLWSRRKEVWRAARPTKSVARLSPAVISFLPLFGGKTRPLITWIETMRFMRYATRYFLWIIDGMRFRKRYIFSALTIVLSIAPDRRVLAVTASDP